MRCFVIMPFDSSFDDVYTTIKHAVTSVKHSAPVECGRLDDARPAGRITERLVNALRDSSFCVADFTGCRPNVMWETGYAMALGKPIIVLTQDLGSLPFDLMDMQTVHYDRTQLNRTLGSPLEHVVHHTLPLVVAPREPAINEEQSRLVISLQTQLAELKDMVAQVVSTLDQRQPGRESNAGLIESLSKIEGSWVNKESNSNIYIRIIDEVIVAPYCYGGNGELTGCYYDWRELGEYLYARFKWLGYRISGFTFLKWGSDDTLQGAWWYDEDGEWLFNRPPAGDGNQVIWRRTNLPVPSWATEFFEKAKRRKVSDSSLRGDYFQAH